MSYRWKADIFLIRAAGLLKSKCRQHFSITPQLASPQIKFKVAFISNPWLWDPWLWVVRCRWKQLPLPVWGFSMCTSVCEWGLASLRVYDSTHLEHIPGSFGLSGFILVSFILGTRKGLKVIALNVVVTSLAPIQFVQMSKPGPDVISEYGKWAP